MKKVLIVTSVASMIDQFLIPHIHLLQKMNYEVHVACNFETGSTCSNERIAELKQKLTAWNITYYQIEFERNIARVSKNIHAYNKVKKIVIGNKYKLIHCHSPIGGLITRLACRKLRRQGTKVYYTAHGFHFYKGAPLKNWLLYYPVEKFCSHFTDVLITINQEDYIRAKQNMKASLVEYIPGVGIDLEKFGSTVTDKSEKRHELGIPESAKLLISVGELNGNKNHETVLRAIAGMDVYYIIAGKGDLTAYLQNLAVELGVSERVKFLGFRSDIHELYRISNAFIFPSFREGLPVSVMEAMASGLPVVCSRIRGNTDLIDENGGILFDPHSVEDCRRAIEELLSSDTDKMSDYNKTKIREYGTDRINEKMLQLYRREEIPEKEKTPAKV